MKAWQRTIREKRAQENSDADLFGKWWDAPVLSECRVEELASAEAASIILPYEWLGTMPPFPWKCFGVRYRGTLIGANVFVTLRNGNVPYTLFKHPSCALVRGAVVHWAPENTGSFLTRQSVRLIARSSPSIDYAVAFVDSEAGEIGTIYQAAGWTFIGWKPARRWRAPDGKTYNPEYHRNRAWNKHARYAGRNVTAGEVQASAAELTESGWQIVVTGGRGRYACVLRPRGRNGRHLSRLLLTHAKPYPKRAAQESRIDSLGHHQEGAVQSCGAAPITEVEQ